MLKPQRFGSAAAILFLLGTAVGMRVTAMPQTISEFDKILPESVDRWKKTEPPGLYKPETLSDYIDGGAELYLSFNFQSALSVKYKDAAENEIAVDVFDMGTSHDAFGVFAHTRETIDSAFGQGSEYAAGLLTFWKDRYYVSILAYPETPASKDAVFALGRAVAGAIRTEGPLPPVLALLPADGLMPESVRYFHHHVWLNSFVFVSNENVLDIRGDTPAALAKYRGTGPAVFLLIVLYPDAARAESAEGLFRVKILGGAPDGTKALEGGRWTGIERRGERIAVVFNAPDAATVRGVLAKIKN